MTVTGANGLTRCSGDDESCMISGMACGALPATVVEFLTMDGFAVGGGGGSGGSKSRVDAYVTLSSRTEANSLPSSEMLSSPILPELPPFGQLT